MTPELEQLQKEARERMAAHPSIKFANDAIIAHAVRRTGTKGYTGTEYYPELLGELIAKAFLAGEKSGKEKAVNIIGGFIATTGTYDIDFAPILEKARIS